MGSTTLVAHWLQQPLHNWGKAGKALRPTCIPCVWWVLEPLSWHGSSHGGVSSIYLFLNQGSPLHYLNKPHEAGFQPIEAGCESHSLSALLMWLKPGKTEFLIQTFFGFFPLTAIWQFSTPWADFSGAPSEAQIIPYTGWECQAVGPVTGTDLTVLTCLVDHCH